MSIFEALQLITATAVILLSLSVNHVRGAGWTAAIALDLVLSTAYWRMNLPYADAITAMCDFTLCLLIFWRARYRWELWIFLLYQASMLVSIVDLGASIAAPNWIDHDTYSSVLEAINYCAFAAIGGVSGFAFHGHRFASALSPWPRFLASLRPVQHKEEPGRKQVR